MEYIFHQKGPFYIVGKFFGGQNTKKDKQTYIATKISVKWKYLAKLLFLICMSTFIFAFLSRYHLYICIQPQSNIGKGTKWHKSANPCHNFESFSTSVWPEWSLSRGPLVVPGQTSQHQPKMLFISVNPTCGLSWNIEFWGNFEAHSHIYHI